MNTTSVNPTQNFSSTQVMTTVEKNDKARSQVKPVTSVTESTTAALGEKELQQKSSENSEKNFEALSQMAEDIQDRLDMMGSSLGFSIHKKYETIVAEISNRDSGELIKQFPSEDVLALREKLQELVGLFFDKQV